MQPSTAAGPGGGATQPPDRDDLGRSGGEAMPLDDSQQQPTHPQGPGQLSLDVSQPMHWVLALSLNLSARRRLTRVSDHTQLGKPLNCMSVARQHPGASLVAAVGGAQMLKVVSVTPHGLAEKRSLRLTSKVTSEVNFSINDVEWCCKDASRHVLAAGASNGHILLWDVSRDGRASQVGLPPHLVPACIDLVEEGS